MCSSRWRLHFCKFTARSRPNLIRPEFSIEDAFMQTCDVLSRMIGTNEMNGVNGANVVNGTNGTNGSNGMNEMKR